MKTIQAITELAASAPAGEVMAIATVMKVRGSAYRRPGARMLITADGRTAGMISGGCLENDTRLRGREVMATGRPVLVTYDSTAPEDIVFGLGLGCQGIVQVLIEPVTAGDESSVLAFLSACVARRQAGRLATIFQPEGPHLGSRVLRWPDGRVTYSEMPSEIAPPLLRALQENTACRHLVCPIELPTGNKAEILVETVAPPVPLMVFGAGDDAIPLADLARLVGWHVSVIDARAEYAKAERFSSAQAVHCLRPEDLSSSSPVLLAPETMAMIMTHRFAQDKELLRALLPRGLRYVGILGPKSRTQRLLDELTDEGAAFSGKHLARLHSPAGLDIGAETPEEIALSILSEMQAVLGQRRGGALRERTSPIHEAATEILTSA